MLKKEMKSQNGILTILYFGENMLLQASRQELQGDIWLVSYHHGTFAPCIQQVVGESEAADRLAEAFVNQRHESPADLPTDLSKLNDGHAANESSEDTKPGDSPLPPWLQGLDNE